MLVKTDESRAPIGHAGQNVLLTLRHALAGITNQAATRMNARFLSIKFSECRQKYRKFVKCCSCCDSGLQTYQVAGLVIVVPGIGLGNWLAANADPRIDLLKSACIASCCDVFRLGAPGVIKPSVLSGWCCFTRFMDSQRSESLDTITAQSKAFCQASFNM